MGTSELIAGQTIKKVRPMTAAERREEGWTSPGTALVLDNGVVLYASQDPEGNGPGALFGVDKKNKKAFMVM